MRFVPLLILAIFCVSVRGDIVILKDGTRVEGDVKHSDSGYDVTDSSGKVTHVDTYNVESIQLGKSNTNENALDRFDSLKRSVEALDDINQIISRYNTFIQQNPKTPAAEQAQKELAIWQDRLDKHLVKIGGKWVTPEQQEQMLAQAGDTARQGYDLIKENKLKEAEPVVKQVLDIDPQNPVGNYLEGVLLYRAEKIVPARKAFEIVHAQLPSDAATLNNLGVIAWRQNQYMNSLGFYSDAMLALPANKEILNNVAEALAALKDNFKKTPNAQRTSRLFVEQEAQLEHVMSQYGWYRWGSMWIDKDELDALKKAEADVKGKLDKLYSDADDIRRKIRTNSDQITKDQDYINEIASENYVGDGINRTFVPTVRYYPDSYYQAQGELRSLQNDNQNLTNTLTQMGAQAKQLEASKPQPKYTGVQEIIGAEGAPRTAGVDLGPTSAPATPQAANVAETPAAPAAPATQPAPAVQPAPAPTPPPANPPAAAPTTSSVF